MALIHFALADFTPRSLALAPSGVKIKLAASSIFVEISGRRVVMDDHNLSSSVSISAKLVSMAGPLGPDFDEKCKPGLGSSRPPIRSLAETQSKKASISNSFLA